MAMMLEGLPPSEADDKQWLATLRIWLLVHAIDRSFEQNVQDKHLQLVATQLRLACARGREAIEPFALIRCGVGDFDEFNRSIARRAAQVLDDHDANDKRGLLYGLVHIARREHAAIGACTDPTEDFSFGSRLASEFRRRAPPIPTELRDDDSGAEAVCFQFEDDTFDTVAVEVDETQSSAEQRLSATAVLLSSAEDQQFLPWSWNQPNPLETTHLQHWIAQGLPHDDPARAMLAASVWIARATGMSLRRATDIQIDTSLGPDWVLQRNPTCLIRQPPCRRPGWAPRSEAESMWVSDYLPEIRLPIPEPVRHILEKAILRAPDATSIGGLWHAIERQLTPEQYFRQALPAAIDRVTPGMLGRQLPQQIFRATGDATFARLIASHSRTGLPGSCAYASWSSNQVAAALALPDHPHSLLSRTEVREPNAAGSRLDPVEQSLRQSIESAAARLAPVRASADPIAFHNVLTAYVTVAFLAATGARPVHDPIESATHIDVDGGHVFIDDKTSGDIRQGRLVPLVGWLNDFFQVTYPRHLGLLAGALAGAAPELAKHISELVFRPANASLPYLFLLETDDVGAIDWQSISETALSASGLFEWPLPYNLFRHRFSRAMRMEGVDPEIIDGLLGHAELGSATYGDMSTRVWKEDAASARPAMTAIFHRLGFIPPDTWSSAPLPLPARRRTPDSNLPPRHFGMAARTEHRQRRREATCADAQAAIDDYLAGRTLSDLTVDEIDTMIRLMLFYPNGLPRPTANLRYHYLQGKLDKAWAEKDRPVKIRRRYLRMTEDHSPFTEQGVGAVGHYQDLRRDLRSQLDGVAPSRLSKHACSGIAAVLLCLENRIADVRLLQDIAAGKGVRLVTLSGRVYLEYAESLARDDTTAPVVRYEIGLETARFLDRALSAKRRAASENLPAPLRALAARMPPRLVNDGTAISLDKLIAGIANIVDQANAQTLPGVVAAFLSGRVQSYSLHWCNWIRVMTGKRVRLPEIEASGLDLNEPLEGVLPAGSAVPLAEELDNIALQRNARKLYSYLRKILGVGPDNLPRLASAERRRDIVRTLEGLLKQNAGKVSTAILLLGQWSTVLVVRMKKSRQKMNALSSVTRYVGALSPIFEQVAYRDNLFAMDDDAVTDFYERILAASAAENLGYVAERLKDFHRWARSHGVEDPDWAVLSVGQHRHRTVAPGLVVERDYLDALKLLTADKTHEGRLSAFLLICAYRFGLRGAEALWLSRKDWRILDEQVVVLVRKNRIKSLKTQHAVRQVPLLFHLSELEKLVISRVLDESAARFGDQNALLFATREKPHEVVGVSRLKRAANLALAQATGIGDLTLHDARHSFANAVAIQTFKPALPKGWYRWNDGIPADIESILLARTGNSRRRPWAVARALGHAKPSTSLESYIHFLGEWAGELVPVKRSGTRSMGLATAIDLDALPPSATIDFQAIPPRATAASPSTAALVKFVRLLARGKSRDEAAAAQDIPPQVAEKLYSSLATLGSRFALNPSRSDPKPADPGDPVSFLRRFGERVWQRLLRLAADVDSRREKLLAMAPDTQLLPAPESDCSVMFGATRQLMLWEERHFAWARQMLDLLGIAGTSIRCIHSPRCDEQTRTLARQYRFAPLSPVAAGKADRPIYPDRVFVHNGQLEVMQRMAVVFSENASEEIRNSLEFCVVTAILAACD